MTSKPPPSLLRIVQKVASLSEIYWHDDCFPKEFAIAKTGWLAALVQFTAGYAYERQGAAPAYRWIAREALVASGEGIDAPTESFARNAWAEFEKRAKTAGVRPNPKLNPLNFRSQTKIPVTRFVASMEASQFNILRWATCMIKSGDAEEATRRLRSIRGVGWKLATFYLRDVARYFDLDEEPGWCFQPADVWIQRVAGHWGQMLSRNVAGYDAAAELFVELAQAAGVRGGDLNAGAWVLGSQLLDRDLAEVVCSEGGFQSCVDKNLRWNVAVSGVLERLRAR